MLLKIKTFGFQNNYTRYEKNVKDKIVDLEEVYKLNADYFLIGHLVFVLIVKNVI